MTDLMTTQEVAGLLGVGPTAIKRWADSGVLPCVRTAGGHRRYRRSDVEPLLKAGEGPSGVAAATLPRWIDELLSDGGTLRVESMLMSERATRGSWHGVARMLGGWLEELGLAWEQGRLTILQEHVVSERLARALARIGESLPFAPDSPRALLVVPEGDDHTLGLSLVELCLREAGWRTHWAGRMTPVDEVVRAVGAGAVEMVVASASMHSHDADALARWVAQVGDACARGSVPLLLGGTGAWPETPVYGTRLRDLEPLRAFLMGLTAAGPRRVRSLGG